MFTHTRDLENDELKKSRIGLAHSLGLAYLKTIITLNSGAILATLTFIGSASAQTTLTIPLENIKCAMISFLVGITSILIALLISYSFTATHPSYKYAIFWDKWIIPTNVLVSLISLISFVVGVHELISGASATQ